MPLTEWPSFVAFQVSHPGRNDTFFWFIFTRFLVKFLILKFIKKPLFLKNIFFCTKINNESGTKTCSKSKVVSPIFVVLHKCFFCNSNPAGYNFQTFVIFHFLFFHPLISVSINKKIKQQQKKANGKKMRNRTENKQNVKWSWCDVDKAMTIKMRKIHKQK